MKRVILGLIFLAISSIVAMAVQDGKGTNIFGHVRIKDGYSVTFGGVSRTNWPMTNGMITGAVINAGSSDSVTTNGGMLEFTWNTNAAAGGATDISGKLDKTNGLAVNLTVTGTFTRAMSAVQTITNNGMEITVGQNFALVQSDTGDKTAGLAVGTKDGQEIIVKGANTNTATLTNNTGFVNLIEAVDFTFGSNNTMQLIWDGVKWNELHRGAPQ